MANPVFRSGAFAPDLSSSGVMTVGGAIQKSALLLAICGGAAYFSWGLGGAATFPALIIGFILCMVICFKPQTAPYLSPVYAAAEGVFLGTISSLFEGQMHGIVLQALLLTSAVFCTMLGLYQTRIIQPSKMFFSVIVGATGGICLTYLVSIVLGLFGIHLGFLYGNGSFAILFSLIVCAVAAMNLIIDFAVIEQGAESGAPKYMEWYGAFGLLVTLVWLYLEVLRLLAKLRSR
jgi:uncharacterized YccA/Bax inhibitor family protein